VSGGTSPFHRLVLGGAAAASAAGWAAPAAAHGFGGRYDLPVPLGLYLGGAAAAVALSFVMMALFYRQTPAATRQRPEPVFAVPGILCGLLGVFGVAVLVLVVIAGFFGNQSPVKNIAPVTVWVLWWVGIAYVAAVIGNVWRCLNPWNAVARWIGNLSTGGLPPIRYPAGLGCWPAVVLFVAFAWMELAWPGSEAPLSIAGAVAAYSAVTWIGMTLFGRRTWLEAGEAFWVIFGIMSRFAPLQPADSYEASRPRLRLRGYGTALVAERPVSVSLTAMVLAMLATVTFDGFKETSLWLAIRDGILATEALRPVLLLLRDLTGDLKMVIETIGLLAFPLLFTAVYLVFSALTRLAAGTGDRTPTTGETARWFVLSLVPIAIGYHLAHYLSYLMIAGQMAIPLASDPLGQGWDLFGTARYRIDIGVINARTVWSVSVAAIVVGHIAAVAIAHRTAFLALGDAKRAIRSQIPMLVLMVGYTTVSLWILAQPIVE